MYNHTSFIRRIGTILVVTFFVTCIIGGAHQASSAPQPKAWKPGGPQTIIVDNYGGAYDLMARQIGQVLPGLLGQKVIVQAVTGAGGGNALDTIQKAKPDGRTMGLLGFGTYLVCAMEKRYSWDVNDFPLILAIDAPPYVVSASPKSPYSSYEDLVKMKKEVRIALAGENFAVLPLLLDFQNKGIQFKAARFKGSGEANLAVIAGNADLTVSAASGSNLDKMRSGDLRPLWVYDTQRFPSLTNVPTHVELGLPKEWAIYHIMRLIPIAPRTPEDIQRGLKEALIAALKDGRTIEWSKKAETPVDIVPEEEYKERVRGVLENYKKHWQMIGPYF